MTLLTRYDPLLEFSIVQERVNRMNRLSRESFSPEGPEEALTTSSFAPPVDIYEDEHNIVLKLEVPGSCVVSALREANYKSDLSDHALAHDNIANGANWRQVHQTSGENGKETARSYCLSGERSTAGCGISRPVRV